MTNSPTGRLGFDHMSDFGPNPCNEIPLTASGPLTAEQVAHMKALISDGLVVLISGKDGLGLTYPDPLTTGISYEKIKADGLSSLDFRDIEIRAMAHQLEDHDMRDNGRRSLIAGMGLAALLAGAVGGDAIHGALDEDERRFRVVTPRPKPKALQRSPKRAKRGRGTYQATKRQKKSYKGSTAAKRATARGGNHAAQNYRFA